MIEPKNNIKKFNRMKDFGNDRTSYVRFDKNERTIPFDEKIYKEILSKIENESIPMYPNQGNLYDKLSNFLKVDTHQLLLTPGSDAAIKSIYETYINSGDKIVYLWPTYAMIDVYADMFEAKKTKIEFSSNLELDYEFLIENIDENSRVVFIANPNQPTGTVLDDKKIYELVQKCYKTDTLVVFDEAYHQFSNQESCIKYINDFSNVVVTQTFSKAFGAASVRLGYIVSQKVNIDWLYKVKTYADINMFALKIGEYLIDNYWIVEDYVRQIEKSKILLKEELQKEGISTIKSYANFIHLKFPDGFDLNSIAENMKSKGYLIRTTGMGLPAVLENCIRVTIGPPYQMKKFLDDLISFIRKKN